MPDEPLSNQHQQLLQTGCTAMAGEHMQLPIVHEQQVCSSAWVLETCVLCQ